jgi:ribonuclease P/MRP protein subunit RPP40
MEHIIFQKIMHHCIEHKLLSDRQYGFIKGRSVEGQLLSRIHDWISSLERNIPIDSIYLDIKRAYDTVCIKRLLRLLRKLKFPEQLVLWLEQYLTIRNQTVRINGIDSAIETLTLGLPQGSVLSPILFILYINDAEQSIKYSELYYFADDMVLYKAIQNEEDSYLLQSDLNRIVHWAKNNKL